MNSSRLPLVLALSLLTLLPPTRCATPLAQFGQTLDSSVAQFGLLANAGYNTQSFPQLIELLSNLFGSMMVFSEPYLNSFISQTSAQNANILAQIQLLEARFAAGSNSIFQALNSASATLGSAIANIGATIFMYQNEDNARLYGINSRLAMARAGMDNLNVNVPALTTLVAQIEAKLQTATNNLAPIQALVDAAASLYPDLYSVNLDASNLVATSKPNCFQHTLALSKTYIPGTNDVTAQAYPDQAAADLAISHFYDTQIISAGGMAVVLEVCTRDALPLLPGVDKIVLKAVVY